MAARAVTAPRSTALAWAARGLVLLATAYAAAAAAAATADPATSDHDKEACTHPGGPSFLADSPTYPVVMSTLVACIVLSLLSTLLSLYLIHEHFRRFTQPRLQVWIVRILIMVPIYAVCSTLSFRFYWLSYLFDIGRDAYEAFVLYSFFCLMLQYIGPDDAHQRAAMQKLPDTPYPFPFQRWRYNPRGNAFLLNARYWILQYVVISPSLALLAYFLEAFHAYCEGSFSFAHGYVYLYAVNFISVSAAMTMLVMFFYTVRPLLGAHPVGLQLIAVKLVVFLNFWQGLVLSAFETFGWIHDWEDLEADAVVSLWNSGLMCAEMVLAAGVHIYAFAVPKAATGTDAMVMRLPATHPLGVAHGGVGPRQDAAHPSPAPDATDPDADPELEIETEDRVPYLRAIMLAFSPLDIWYDIAAAPAQLQGYRQTKREKRLRAELEGLDEPSVASLRIEPPSAAQKSVRMPPSAKADPAAGAGRDDGDDDSDGDEAHGDVYDPYTQTAAAPTWPQHRLHASSLTAFAAAAATSASVGLTGLLGSRSAAAATRSSRFDYGDVTATDVEPDSLDAAGGARRVDLPPRHPLGPAGAWRPAAPAPVSTLAPAPVASFCIAEDDDDEARFSPAVPERHHAVLETGRERPSPAVDGRLAPAVGPENPWGAPALAPERMPAPGAHTSTSSPAAGHFQGFRNADLDDQEMGVWGR